MYAEHEQARAKARDALRLMVMAQIEATIAAGGKAADGYQIAMAVTGFERDAVAGMLDGLRFDYAGRYPEEAVPE